MQEAFNICWDGLSNQNGLRLRNDLIMATVIITRDFSKSAENALRYAAPFSFGQRD